MEVHACDFYDKHGVGDKEESFIEQGHQIGITVHRRYCGIKNIKKKMESTLKARSISSHPLVKQHSSEVLHGACWTKVEDNSTLKRKKVGDIKREEKRIKRKSYICLLLHNMLPHRGQHTYCNSIECIK
jgi:hypothetical protein